MTTSTMSSTIETVKAEQSNNGTSDKNPKYYNQKKNRFALEMLTFDDPIVRAAAALSINVPTTLLNTRLASEDDPNVLRAILFNPAVSNKSIVAFSQTGQAKMFDEDEELITHISAKLRGDDEEDAI